jgi:hypothetical protein
VAETPVQPVVKYLEEKRIISDEHAEDIIYQNTDKNKVQQLLTILVRSGPKAFPTFVEALRSIDCDSLASSNIITKMTFPILHDFVTLSLD